MPSTNISDFYSKQLNLDSAYYFAAGTEDYNKEVNPPFENIFGEKSTTAYELFSSVFLDYYEKQKESFIEANQRKNKNFDEGNENSYYKLLLKKDKFLFEIVLGHPVQDIDKKTIRDFNVALYKKLTGNTKLDDKQIGWLIAALNNMKVNNKVTGEIFDFVFEKKINNIPTIREILPAVFEQLSNNEDYRRFLTNFFPDVQMSVNLGKRLSKKQYKEIINNINKSSKKYSFSNIKIKDNNGLIYSVAGTLLITKKDSKAKVNFLGDTNFVFSENTKGQLASKLFKQYIKQMKDNIYSFLPNEMKNQSKRIESLIEKFLKNNQKTFIDSFKKGITYYGFEIFDFLSFRAFWGEALADAQNRILGEKLKDLYSIISEQMGNNREKTILTNGKKGALTPADIILTINGKPYRIQVKEWDKNGTIKKYRLGQRILNFFNNTNSGYFYNEETYAEGRFLVANAATYGAANGKNPNQTNNILRKFFEKGKLFKGLMLGSFNILTELLYKDQLVKDVDLFILRGLYIPSSYIMKLWSKEIDKIKTTKKLEEYIKMNFKLATNEAVNLQYNEIIKSQGRKGLEPLPIADYQRKNACSATIEILGLKMTNILKDMFDNLYV